MGKEEENELIREIPEWELVREVKHRIVRKFVFKDFREAMEFVNKVARIAEEENHHPDILVVYKRVTLTLFTHEVGGLSTNDFILAAKINEIQP